MQLETKKSADFARVAVALRTTIEGFKTDSATIVALWGDLGAGKTTLTQYLAKSFGIEDDVVSPTFVIMKIYDLENENTSHLARGHHAEGFASLVHIDAYRFENPKEASGIRLHELIANPKNLIVIEWPELLGDRLPEHRIDVKIEHDGDGRKISIDKV